MEKVSLTHLLQNFKYQPLSQIFTDVSYHVFNDLFLYNPFSRTHSFTEPGVQQAHPLQFGMPITVSSTE